MRLHGVAQVGKSLVGCQEESHDGEEGESLAANCPNNLHEGDLGPGYLPLDLRLRDLHCKEASFIDILDFIFVQKGGGLLLKLISNHIVSWMTDVK